MYIFFGQNEASKEEQDQEEERSQSICDHQVSGQRTDGSEQGDCHIVDEESEQPEHEDSARIQSQRHGEVPTHDINRLGQSNRCKLSDLLLYINSILRTAIPAPGSRREGSRFKLECILDQCKFT